MNSDCNGDCRRYQQRIMADWPIATSAYACLDCWMVFRQPQGSQCPFCGSNSFYDITQSKRRTRNEEDPS